MTDYPAPLTPAEQIAAEHFAQLYNRMAEPSRAPAPEDFANEARAVVAAVRSSIEADVLDALADAAADYGPPTVDHLRGSAFIARQGRSIVDWLADDRLSLPASKETPNGN